MKRFAPIGMCVLAILTWDCPAWSAPGGGGSHGGGGHSFGSGHASGSGSHAGFGSGGSAGRAAPAAPGASSFVQGGGHSTPGRPSSPPPAGAINPSFPSRLGGTVGLHPFPPGVGNINQPGLPPGSPPAIGNINNPGVPRRPPFPLNPPRGQHPFPGRFGYPFFGFGPIFYGIPFFSLPIFGYGSYVPDMGYGMAPSVSNPPEDQIYSEIAPTVGPESSYMLPDTEESSQQPPATAPEARPLSLLAFKDHSIVAVTDYWLEGETLYYETSYSGRVGIPLGQVDLPLTQQLNRERNLRFVLESR
jgi:hypothetical protein